MEHGVDLLARICSASVENKALSMDASREGGSFTPSVNEEHKHTHLRRKKTDVDGASAQNSSSHKMKDADLQKYSGELFDSTAAFSDDYFSDSTSDSESDASLTPNQTILQLLDEELDEDESASVSSLELESAAVEAEAKPEPESAASETEECSVPSPGGIIVSACQKRDGGRVYNKRHYCLFCSKPYAKMARHLESSHANKPEVETALSFPKGSKERKKQLDYIRNRGNYAHNAVVMQCGRGELVPSKRPPRDAQGEDFMHCAYCQGLYTRKVLWRHMRTCGLKPQSSASRPGKNRVQSMCTYTGPVPANMSQQLWAVISAMNPGPVTEIIRKDRVIVKIGQHLLNKGGVSAQNKQYVRDKMRELGRLVHNARKTTSIKTLQDCLNPRKFTETIEAVKSTCGFESESGSFRLPSLARKLGISLLKVSKLLKAQGLISSRRQQVRSASEFQELHRAQWGQLISRAALRSSRSQGRSPPLLMAFVEDVQKMHTHLRGAAERWSADLAQQPSGKAWTELAKVCLAQMMLLNRRREGAVSSMPISAYLSRDSDPMLCVNWTHSEVENRLWSSLGSFTRIITRGRCGRPVPVLLNPSMQFALDLLVHHREECGVPKDNSYMFARPAAMTHFRGSDCLRGFARSCGAASPESLTSGGLRNHTGALLSVMDLTDRQMQELQNALGLQNTLQPTANRTLELARISKLLLALQQGRLAEYYGRSLEEIRVEPDEKVVVWDEERRSTQEDLRSPTVIGKRVQKKQPWQQTEVQAVERHMMNFITSCTVPAKSHCESCLQAEPEALRNRDWKSLKFFIYNRITAYKRNLQSAGSLQSLCTAVSLQEPFLNSSLYSLPEIPTLLPEHSELKTIKPI
ncbi:uncharacterized protein isoform X1 [Danio rerio]|uniref:Uncharacterized protein isoform X1 n=1 Tax=Danio rerio TaxID=7955 RepID=A0A8M2BIU9_DANRE|nr:uncharacterized protein LOC100005990 [Danio rerio]|eukprot:XP_005171592.1 uncharacterized protein LOC100005990 [Danio rerio]